MGGNKSKEQQEKVSEQEGSSSSPVAVQKSSPAPSGAPANATSPSTVLSSTTSTTTEPKPELPAPGAAAPAVKVAEKAPAAAPSAAATATSERTSVAADEQQKQALEQAKAKSEKLELTPLKVPRAAAAEPGDRTPMDGREVSVRSDSSSSSLSSYAMAESIGVGRCVDLLLFSPEEVKVFQEALSVIAGNADNEADYPLEEDLWELAKEKLAALMSPSLRLMNCKATMVYVIKTYVDRKGRTVINKAKILPEIRAMVVKQVTELQELVANSGAGGKSGTTVVPAAVYEKDYWLWSGAANQWKVPELAEPFPAFPMKDERIALLKAIFSADPVKFSSLAKDIARDVHVLMTLPNYLEYEESTPIEKSRLKNASNDGAKALMRGQMARRVLLNVLPERTVLNLVPGAFESVDRIMSNAEKLCEKFLAQPLVVPVFKEQKKKAEKGGKAKGGDAKAAPAPKAAAASPAPAAASNKKPAASSPPSAAAPPAKKAKTDAGNCCSSASTATTTTPTPTDAALQKLRTDEIGSVLYYKYVVSHQNGSAGGSGSSSQQPPSCTAGATTSAGVANAAAAAVGQNVHVEGKFDTVWCGGGKIPQGHTGYSFTADSLSGDCVPEVIERSKFGRVWAAIEGNVPQGHTPYSFFFGTAAAASASSSSTAPPAKAAFSPEPRAAAASSAPAAGKKSAKPSAAPAKPTAPATTATSSSSNNIDPEALAALKKLDLRVGQIVKVERIPISEGLYKTQVDMGGGVTRQICGGLVKHYPEGEKELLNRKILTFFNIKPAKLAGESSEGMILAGAIDNHGPNEQCELLELGGGGENVEVGTKLTLKNLLTVGEEAATTSSKNIHKQWQKAQPLFSVDAESRAMFGGKHEWVVVGKDGKEVPVRVPTLKNAAIC